MVAARPISAFTAGQTKLSTDMRPSTTRAGEKNSLAWIFHGALIFLGDRLARISLPKGCLSPISTLEIACGFYFSVEQEGVVENGEAFEFLSHEPEAITITEMNRLFVEDRYNHALLEKAIATPALPEDWREYLEKRLPGAATVKR